MWMLTLGTVSSLSLGIGIPVVAVTVHNQTQIVGGPVMSVDPSSRTLVLHDLDGPTSTHGSDVTVRLPRGRRVDLTGNTGGTGRAEDLGDLAPGQIVRARISTRAGHWARWVKLSG
jgi:hypothetical protein